MSGGCGDNAAIKKGSLSRENEHARQEREVTLQWARKNIVKEM